MNKSFNRNTKKIVNIISFEDLMKSRGEDYSNNNPIRINKKKPEKAIVIGNLPKGMEKFTPKKSQFKDNSNLFSAPPLISMSKSSFRQLFSTNESEKKMLAQRIFDTNHLQNSERVREGESNNLNKNNSLLCFFNRTGVTFGEEINDDFSSLNLTPVFNKC